MRQTVIFYSGFLNNTWIKTFFARNEAALAERGIVMAGRRLPHVFAHALDFAPDPDPARVTTEIRGHLERGARTVLLPSYGCYFPPEIQAGMITLCRKGFSDVETVWHVTISHPVASLLYSDSLKCFYEKIYFHSPFHLERMLPFLKKKQARFDHLYDALHKAADTTYIRKADAAKDCLRAELDSLLALAEGTKSAASFDYTPPALLRPLSREGKAWVLALRDLFPRFGQPELDWNGEAAALAGGISFAPTLPLEECAAYEEAYANDRKHYAGLLIWGQSWEELTSREPSPFPELTPDDAALFLSLHTPAFCHSVKAYLSRLNPKFLTPRETVLFRPWLRGGATGTPDRTKRHDQPQIEVSPSRPKVSVLTPTYNHAPFIRDCLEGVLAQKTGFPVEHIVADDGSTDGTAEIIKDYAARYPHIIPVLHEFRVGGTVNHRDMYRMARAPYVALCDGDDYFSDPGKLQAQADLLDTNPDMGLCFHFVRVCYENGTFPDRLHPIRCLLPRGVRPYYHLIDLIRWNMIQTNSVMYRWRFTGGIPSWLRMDLVPGDWYLHLLHAETGKIGFIDRVMGVYRRHEASQYYSAEVDRVLHRHKTGLAELETLKVINTHFKGRYESIVSVFADRVISDLFLYSIREHDNTDMEQAYILYPDFFRHVLQNMLKTDSSVKAHIK